MTLRVIPANASMTLGCDRTRRIWGLSVIPAVPVPTQQKALVLLRILNNAGSLEAVRAVPGLHLRRVGRTTRPVYRIDVDTWHGLRFEWTRGAAARVVLAG